MEEYPHNFKEIANGGDLSPLNPLECEPYHPGRRDHAVVVTML